MWVTEFPFPGSGTLNRLCVHPSVVDFAERALDTRDVRIYQTHATASYSGLTNYEQPMHMDRNHSWLPPGHEPPWWNLEGFLYLSDVTEADNPTRVVSVTDSSHVRESTPILMPDRDPGLYASEQRAAGVRGSFLAYRSDVFHRGAPFGAEERARFMLAVAFNGRPGVDRLHQAQSKSTQPEWTVFAEGSTPRELSCSASPRPATLSGTRRCSAGPPSLPGTRPRPVAPGARPGPRGSFAVADQPHPPGRRRGRWVRIPSPVRSGR